MGRGCDVGRQGLHPLGVLEDVGELAAVPLELIRVERDASEARDPFDVEFGSHERRW